MAEAPRKKIAGILTWYTVGSHSDVLVGKFLPGRGIPADDGFHDLRVDLWAPHLPPPVLLRGILTACGARVSLYIDQMPEGEPDEDGPCKRRHPHASRPRLLTVAV